MCRSARTRLCRALRLVPVAERRAGVDAHHGIWVFAIASILAIFALTRAFWGDLAGVIAAGLWAVLPISHDILAWHGAPNLAAICLLALVLAYLAVLTVRRPRAR